MRRTYFQALDKYNNNRQRLMWPWSEWKAHKRTLLRIPCLRQSMVTLTNDTIHKYSSIHPINYKLRRNMKVHIIWEISLFNLNIFVGSASRVAFLTLPKAPSPNILPNLYCYLIFSVTISFMDTFLDMRSGIELLRSISSRLTPSKFISLIVLYLMELVGVP